MDIVALYIGSYLLGSIPTAYLIGRMVKGVDIRGYGSGNLVDAPLDMEIDLEWFKGEGNRRATGVARSLDGL